MTIKPNKVPSKKLKEIWAQVPPNYYDEGIEKNLFQKMWHTRKLAQVLKLLPNDKNTRKKILDVGCSSAVLTSHVASYLPKSKITGLDSYKAAIAYAKKKYPNISFVTADAHKIPFKNNTFDVIICTETLEHVVDPLGVIKEMKRVLKNDGQAIISMDSGSLPFRIIWYFWTKTKGKVWEDAHLHEFNAKLLASLIRKAGFRIKKENLSHLGMSVTFLATNKKAANV